MRFSDRSTVFVRTSGVAYVFPEYRISARNYTARAGCVHRSIQLCHDRVLMLCMVMTTSTVAADVENASHTLVYAVLLFVTNITLLSYNINLNEQFGRNL